MNSLRDVVLLPHTFGVYAVAAAILVFDAACFWESKTAPGVATFARPRSYSTQGRSLREDHLWSGGCGNESSVEAHAVASLERVSPWHWPTAVPRAGSP